MMKKTDYPKTRQEAIALRVTRYFDGTNCRWGHIAPIKTVSRGCNECKKISDKRSRDKIRDLKKNGEIHRKSNFQENTNVSHSPWIAPGC